MLSGSLATRVGRQRKEDAARSRKGYALAATRAPRAGSLEQKEWRTKRDRDAQRRNQVEKEGELER